MFMFVLLPQL